ncbi:ribosome biogenesis protein SLX9 homolog [Uranotaenia lowii]|uniref:ribosome biogenesis protein SLX9 homolog n=1 Tax=Uranotaenia lowii TaxID=190385 RepID=UPI00247AEF29|nr:ribosome biogenesis protein SLX9 homolog [Uranotaenia lowii]
MGKINKKLQLEKEKKDEQKSAKASDKTSLSGPFPIYRSTPVQLNGPEPKNFKLPSKKKQTSSTVTTPQQEKPLEESDTKPEGSPLKTKKLRKLVISRLNKKDKKKFRKEEVLKKIELTQKSFKADKERKKREKTAVTGDMRPLLDALPSLDSLFKLKSSEGSAIKTGVPKYDKKSKPKTKHQQKTELLKKKRSEFLNRCQKVNQVLKSKKFKKNPKKMIAEHIRNSRKEQLQLLLGDS